MNEQAQTTAYPPETASIACPQCGHGYSMKVNTIVDRGDEEGRRMLLSGRVNVAPCPRCGTPNRVSSPVLYHDAEAEAALVFLPEGLNMPRDKQEQEIGRLTNRVLESLPPEKRKMYLLQPKTFIVEQTFIDAVLESSGVSKDELDRARGRARMIERLMAAHTEDAFAAVLEEREEGTEYELMLLVRAMHDDAAQAGDGPRARALAALQQRLIEHLGEPSVSIDDVIDELEKARAAGALHEIVSHLRPMLDYSFFAELTSRIDAADDSDRADQLRALRSELLDAIDGIDASAKQAVEAAVDLLKWVLAARSPRPALESRLDDVTPAFFLVLQANIQAAQENGDQQIVSRLHEIYEAAVSLVEEQMEPRDRLVNQLAQAASTDARAALLDAASDEIDAELVAELRRTAAEARSGGAEDLASNLENAATEADMRLARVETP